MGRLRQNMLKSRTLVRYLLAVGRTAACRVNSRGMASSACACACRVGTFSARHQSRDSFNAHFMSPAILPVSESTKQRGAKTIQHCRPVAVLPLLSLAAEASDWKVTTVYNDWMLDEMTIKNIYLCFSLFFMWGCCVFGAMKDPFYDSDLYRGEGGDGSGNWIYQREEEEEVKAREELWREELAREIEERVGELRASEEEAQKEKELV